MASCGFTEAKSQQQMRNTFGSLVMVLFSKSQLGHRAAFKAIV
jgi:hypothetical protein